MSCAHVPDCGKPRLRGAAAVVMMLAFCGGWGCVADAGRSDTARDDAVRALRRAEARELFASDNFAIEPWIGEVMETHFHIWRFSYPIGDSGEMDAMWKHLDESAVPSDQAVILQRNGLRVGVGQASAWPAVRALLLRPEPRLWHESVAAAGGRPLLLEVDQARPYEPLFFYDHNHRLTGDSYRGGTLCLHIAHTMDIDHLGRTRLVVTPELRHKKGEFPLRLERRLGMISEDDVRRFEALSFQVDLSVEDFVIIGPCGRARLSHLVGSRMLHAMREDRDWEEVYCVVPRLYRRQIAADRRAGALAEIHDVGKPKPAAK